LFWDIPGSKPVWLSGAESKLKITANSTFWEADLNDDHPFLPISEKNTCFEHFPPYPFYRIYQGNQVISIPENSHAYGNSQRWEHHVHVSEIIYIGKEANNIDEPLETGKVQVFRNDEKERFRIINMRQCDAERQGIDRKTRWRMKNDTFIL